MPQRKRKPTLREQLAQVKSERLAMRLLVALLVIRAGGELRFTEAEKSAMPDGYQINADFEDPSGDFVIKGGVH